MGVHVCVCDEGGGGSGGVRVMEVVECMHGGGDAWWRWCVYFGGDCVTWYRGEHTSTVSNTIRAFT